MQGQCVTTGSDSTTVTIRAEDHTLKAAEAQARTAAPKELGGILIGWWEDNHIAVVHALIPVPDEHAGHTHYERRWSSAQQILDDYLRRSNDARIGYIGEWHSHPGPYPPSWTDRSELKSISRQSGRPVALIVISLAPTGDMISYGLISRPRWPRRISITSARIKRDP